MKHRALLEYLDGGRRSREECSVANLLASLKVGNDVVVP